MYRGIFTVAAITTLSALAAPVSAGDMTDCKYTGSVAGKTATIVVEGGEPVSYKWGSYTAKTVSMSGNKISIDQAAIENLSIGKTQSGKAAFQGDWKFKGNSSKVTFTC